MRTAPPTTDCPKAKKTWRGKPGKHTWNYSMSWGVNQDVIPFFGARGVSRSGWRCFECGEFCWAESDEQFARDFAIHVDRRVKGEFNLIMGRDRWGRKLDHYQRCVTYKKHPFVLTVTDESITVRCGKDIVARWSSGDMEQDQYDYDRWMKLFGCEVVDAADMVA